MQYVCGTCGEDLTQQVEQNKNRGKRTYRLFTQPRFNDAKKEIVKENPKKDEKVLVRCSKGHANLF